MTTIRTVTRQDAHEAIAARENFRYSQSATGLWTSDVTVGELNHKESAQLLKHLNKGLEFNEPSFIVFSYETPIAAWNAKRGWWTTDRYFSRTTCRHQNFVRAGIEKNKRRRTSLESV